MGICQGIGYRVEGKGINQKSKTQIKSKRLENGSLYYG
jgi:hypothetical protein